MSDFYTKLRLQDSEAQDRVDTAMKFMAKVDVESTKGEELELAIQHVALLISPNNEFSDNTNVDASKRNMFYNMIDLMHDSDIDIWCRKLGQSMFWRDSNVIITNVVWNWLNGSLDEPSVFVEYL